jgi:hypothetical protein
MRDRRFRRQLKGLRASVSFPFPISVSDVLYGGNLSLRFSQPDFLADVAYGI